MSITIFNFQGGCDSSVVMNEYTHSNVLEVLLVVVGVGVG